MSTTRGLRQPKILLAVSFI